MNAEANACECEDATGAQYTIRDIRVLGQSKASATYEALYGGGAKSIKLTLHKEDGQWRIHDVGTKATASLHDGIELVNKLLEAQKQKAPAVSQLLTSAQLDGIREQIGKCWNIPAGALAIKNLVVELRLSANLDGTITQATVIDKQRFATDPLFRGTAESLQRAALNRQCNPLHLPTSKYEAWKELVVDFSANDIPTGGPALGSSTAQIYKGALSTNSEVPPAAGNGSGNATVNFDPTTKRITYNVSYTGLGGPALAAHIHCGAAAGSNSGVAVAFPNPVSPITGSATLTDFQVADLVAGRCYVNIHTAAYKAGELRAQLMARAGSGDHNPGSTSDNSPTLIPLGTFFSEKRVGELRLLDHDQAYGAKTWAISTNNNICMQVYVAGRQVTYTYTVVTFPPGQTTPLANDAVAKELLQRAMSLHKSKCPNSVRSVVYVPNSLNADSIKKIFDDLFLWDHPMSSSSNVLAFLYQVYFDTGSPRTTYGNQVAENYRQRLQLKSEQDTTRAFNEQASGRRAEFYAKTGPVLNISVNDLLTNPFPYNGQTVVMQAHFERMRTADEGIFMFGFPNAIVMKDIPGGLFRQPANLVIAGKIAGKTQLANVDVLLLSYVAAYRCSTVNCEDFYGKR